MFAQPLVPFGNSLVLSFLLAASPIFVTLIMMGVLRRPAWQATLGGLIIGLVMAVTVWKLPVSLAFASITNGMVFSFLPVMWIALSALFLFNIATQTGRFDAFRMWIIKHLPNDRRVMLVVLGFCFSAALEGVAGFGTPVAITSALLIMLGFPALEALTYVLIFNSAPVAFGGLGIPITVLSSITGLPAPVLGSTIGLQLAPFACLIPFYVVALYAGWRSIKQLWPVLLVAGGSFALTMVLVSTYISYNLSNVLSSSVSLVVTILFLKVWSPAPDAAYAIDAAHLTQAPAKAGAWQGPHWQGWIPWIVVILVVIVWDTLHLSKIGATPVHWPGLDKQVFISLYQKPYAAIWNFEPLGTGTAIFVSAILTALLTGASAKQFSAALVTTAKQGWLAVITVALTIGLAFLMNYSGMTYTLGYGVASTGVLFPLVSVFLGWIAVFLTGSDTSGNALFGNLQVAAAHQLSLDPVLFASANSAGGVMGKMISPQNITTGVAVTSLKGQEGVVLARTFKHSIFLTLLMGLVVVFQQYVLR
ncbi:lactate permease [Acetobacter cibinongensis]|uniref:L-lactate permease n=1 Tax=Acetobacter cibinongensis TaxID=146475 RepID=A0A0D6N346_9PROT|nr:L-lactate permease [Acetobacter cibinongensis]GAN60359.1 L-lactate permease [Acetobacter cibinongensis]GBQ18744.1 L-lactate permease [Acetobacter cibinongensis NRIC 0482]GEL58063.1 lactate permease [Acetobacter cibinongensis]